MDSVFCVVDSFEHSRWCNTVLVDGEPAVMYGVAPSEIIPNTGCPWLLGTNKAKALTKELIFQSKPEIELMLASFPFLHNLVHKKNTLSIRWLLWLGFNVDFKRSHGLNDDFLFFFKGAL